MHIILVTLFGLVAIATAQRDYTTPVPILKQINRHNDDGSYSYGYEAADRSFKIETKYPNGEVYGKYGYVDDTGNLREVEYGASKRGFEPQGSDINVPPPTLTNNNPNTAPLGSNEVDDGQYREDPKVYYSDQARYNSKPLPASNFRLDNAPPPQPQYQQPRPQQYNLSPSYNNAPFTLTTPAPYVQPHRFQHQHQPQQSYYQPPAPQYNNVNVPNQHHPALSNIDIWSGSYSVSYTGR